MPDAFFAARKRKRSSATSASAASSKTPSGAHRNGSQKQAAQKKRPRLEKKDEELDSGDSSEGGIEDMDLRGDADEEAYESGDEDETETPAEKRLRLAKLYLESVKESLAEGEFDAAEIDKEIISSRLKQDVLEHSGKVHLFVADSFDWSTQPTQIIRTRGHRYSVTSAVASESGKVLYTAGKEGSIVKWNLHTGKKLTTFYKVRPTEGKGKGKAIVDATLRGHTDEVWALSLSGDGKLLASGGKDRRVCVWDVEKEEWMRSFAGPMCHKDSVSALVFRKGTNQLYTASFDRSVKVFDLSPSVMGYVETLFGHQDQILGLDALRGETCVSVGARDKTARYWKIVEETQLVFRGGGKSRIREVLEGHLGAEDEGEPRTETQKFIEGSLECVALIDETTFVSGGDTGSICLWNTQKKKPVFTYPLAHGLSETVSETEGLIRTPRWVTAVSALRYSDLFASGSWDGHIRLWKLDSKLKSFSPLGSISALGVVNSLQLVSPLQDFWRDASWASRGDEAHGRRGSSRAGSIVLVAGVGQEHKFGRWIKVKDGAVNGSIVVALHPR